jgi:hypothetical protein
VDDECDLKMDETDSYDVAITSVVEVLVICCSSSLLQATSFGIEIGMKLLSVNSDIFDAVI